ncbi:DUF99 family protein [Candidatus Woesearchaeota archaeon]|nr:DUF99 family protein [Candidatus Woesearchaeota archaeon]
MDNIKKEIRVLGIDDAPFDKYKKGNTIVVGTMFRGGQFIDGVLSTKIRVDGNNSTAKIINMVNRSKFKPQLQVMMLDGIAVGGFNVVDVQKLNNETGLPVIVVMRDYPNLDEIKSVLKKIGKENKIKLLEKAGKIHKVGKIYIQIVGIDIETATKIIRVCTTRSFIPEPIRVAHLIGGGIISGESKGRA